MINAILKVLVVTSSIFSPIIEICGKISLNLPILIKKSIFDLLAISTSNEPIFKILDTFPIFFGVRNQLNILLKSTNDP